jgi:hypothetical protein
VRHLVGRDLTVIIDGDSYPLTVVDWTALAAASQALAARGAGLSPDERNDLFNRESDPATEIFEYFLDGYDDEVAAGRWVPFGLIGLGYPAESFAELDHDGLLVFDLDGARGDEAPVRWVRDGEVFDIADSLDDLEIVDEDD